MLVRERKYEIGYKPRICIISGTLLYIKKKDMDKYNRLKMTNRQKEKDKLVNKLFIYEILSTIDDNNKIPTKNLENALYRKIWRFYNLPGNITEYNIKFNNIRVITNHGRVNYLFDEFRS